MYFKKEKKKGKLKGEVKFWGCSQVLHCVQNLVLLPLRDFRQSSGYFCASDVNLYVGNYITFQLCKM